jgi:predicted dehydrogenase
MSAKRPTRRRFLQQTATVTAGAIGFPYFVRATALGKDGATAPNSRIVMGTIGTGGMGRGNMRSFMDLGGVQMVAVCDVDRKHADEACGEVNKKNKNQDCKVFKDFRELLAIKDIDAVIVATPDHWHALASIAAANAGKDIYCEKPLTNSVGEGRALCDAVKKNNVVLQCGSHERSGSNARFAAELVRNGKIGELKTVRINLPCDEGHHKEVRAMAQKEFSEMPVPETFDYDFWLGHTPKVFYTEKRCHFYWRFNLNYGGGEMTDRGAHVIDLGQMGMGTDETGPVEYTAKGMRYEKGLFNVFWDYTFENVYANGVKMIGTAKGPRGVKFEGTEGSIFIHVHGQKLEATPGSLIVAPDTSWGDMEVCLGRTVSHRQNFLDAVRTRKQPFASAEVGHRTASICHLNNIAMILGKSFKFDPQTEKSDNEEVNNLLTPKMREPWKL